ncbi:MAG TPA: zinc ribbon domain-containing protein [Solirubrobacteraceae bacterium]|jgi:putative FmdB family regulatory protein|nr:zinc ribbon domain-containing protein [Solirubrobacteraceae bacterium]
MPIYEYRRPDGSTFEILQSFSDEPLTKDPETGVKVQRVLHAPAVHFKGKGFYNTDYGTRKRQRENAAAAESSSKSTSSTDSSSSGDSGASADGKSSSQSESGSKSDRGSSSSKSEQSSPTKKSEPVAAKS